MIEERAMLIAREVIAKKKEADQAPHSAALVRSGKWDDDTEVANAYLGALAALESPPPVNHVVVSHEKLREKIKSDPDVDHEVFPSPHVMGVDWKPLVAKIAHHVTRMNRECVTANEQGNAIAADCEPLFEALGMTFDDGWHFASAEVDNA